MKRVLSMIFWGGMTLFLAGGLLGILYLWISSMFLAQPQGDVFPLLMAGSLLALFIPKTKKRFIEARR